MCVCVCVCVCVCNIFLKCVSSRKCMHAERAYLCVCMCVVYEFVCVHVSVCV